MKRPFKDNKEINSVELQIDELTGERFGVVFKFNRAVQRRAIIDLDQSNINVIILEELMQNSSKQMKIESIKFGIQYIQKPPTSESFVVIDREDKIEQEDLREKLSNTGEYINTRLNIEQEGMFPIVKKEIQLETIEVRSI